jgi:hypothetical protein
MPGMQEGGGTRFAERLITPFTVSLPRTFGGLVCVLMETTRSIPVLATEDPMATQIVMDRSGDTRHNFDANDADALLEAEERFIELTGVGFTAVVRTASGEAVVKRTFDPNAEETLFFPRLVGG